MRVHPSLARRLAGFSLVELLLSLGVLVVVLGAATSVVSFVARGVAGPEDPGARSLAARAAADMLLADIAMATTVEVDGPGDVTLTLPDVDEDGVDEEIRYAWSGTGGQPLVRTVNGQSVALVEGVDGFTLVCESSTRESEAGATTVTGPVERIAGVTPLATSAAIEQIRTRVIGQRFVPRLDESASSWNLREVALWIERDGLPDSTGVVEVRTDSNGQPGSVIVSATFLELTLPATSQRVAFPISRNGLSPSAAYWITTRVTLLASPGEIEQSPFPIADEHGATARSTNGGLSWTIDTDNAFHFEVNGTVTRTVPIIAETTHLAAAAVVITPRGGDDVVLTTRLASRPTLVTGANVPVVEGGSQGTSGLAGALSDLLGALGITGGSSSGSGSGNNAQGQGPAGERGLGIGANGGNGQ
jgi:hypothetical protein